MEKIAFKMLLNSDQAKVYKKRHDEIWDDLVVLLKDAGISGQYFLDPETNILFAVLKRTKDHRMEELPKHEVMQRWWSFIGDIMATQEDGAPVVKPLEFMFHMP